MLAEANVIGWVLAVVFILLCISRVINSVTKTAWKVQGKGNCAFCGARLKSLASTGRGYGYADHCHRCGRPQPWGMNQ